MRRKIFEKLEIEDQRNILTVSSRSFCKYWENMKYSQKVSLHRECSQLINIIYISLIFLSDQLTWFYENMKSCVNKKIVESDNSYEWYI